MPANIVTLQTLDYQPKSFAAVLVALSNAEIHIYKDAFLIDIIKVKRISWNFK